MVLVDATGLLAYLPRSHQLAHLELQPYSKSSEEDKMISDFI